MEFIRRLYNKLSGYDNEVYNFIGVDRMRTNYGIFYKKYETSSLKDIKELFDNTEHRLLDNESAVFEDGIYDEDMIAKLNTMVNIITKYEDKKYNNNTLLKGIVDYLD